MRQSDPVNRSGAVDPTSHDMQRANHRIEREATRISGVDVSGDGLGEQQVRDDAHRPTNRRVNRVAASNDGGTTRHRAMERIHANEKPGNECHATRSGITYVNHAPVL